MCNVDVGNWLRRIIEYASSNSNSNANSISGGNSHNDFCQCAVKHHTAIYCE